MNVFDNDYVHWNLAPGEAVKLQNRFADKVRIEKLPRDIKIIGGADVSYSKHTNMMYAGVVLMHYPELSVIEKRSCVMEAKFPYIPGLLSFREGESLLRCLRELILKPDIILFDGQGIAHPRFLGIASHMGLILDIPAIGVAKSKLVGEGAYPSKKRGDFTYLKYKNRNIAAALCTKDRTKPVFVSPGHRADFEESINLILDLCRQFKLPEPVRAAHNFVNLLRLKGENQNNTD